MKKPRKLAYDLRARLFERRRALLATMSAGRITDEEVMTGAAADGGVAPIRSWLLRCSTTFCMRSRNVAGQFLICA